MPSKKPSMSDNTISCNLRVIGTYAIILVLHIKNLPNISSLTCLQIQPNVVLGRFCHAQCNVTYCRSLSVYVLSESLSVLPIAASKIHTRLSLTYTGDTHGRASHLPVCCYVSRKHDTSTRFCGCKYI